MDNELNIATTRLILEYLYVVNLATDFEIGKHIAVELQRHEADIVPLVPAWLSQLKEQGLLWAGALFNKSNQTLWAATLTKAGRAKAKETIHE